MPQDLSRDRPIAGQVDFGSQSPAALRRSAAKGLLASWLAAVERNPERSFYIFCALHLALWTLLPTLLCNDLPLDVIEGVGYGQQLLLGYWKHPPLTWWIFGLVHRIAGPHLWAYFFVGQVAAVACMWTIWRLGREFLDPLASLVAVLLLEGYVALNIYTKEFNHNIIELPLFGAIGLFLYRAFLRQRLRDFILVGIGFALAFLGKYVAATLLAPVLLFAVIDPQARRCWRNAGPYLAMLVFLALVSPHLAWLVAHDFSPIKYANLTAAPRAGVFSVLSGVSVFVINAILYVVPMALMFLALTAGALQPKAGREAPSNPFSRRYIAMLTFGPLCFSVLAALVMGRSFPARWATPLWCFTSLWLMLFWRPRLDRNALWRLAIAWATVTFLLVVAEIGGDVYQIAPSRYATTAFPGDQFAAAVTDISTRETGRPLEYVIGEFWLAGNVILFSSDSPIMYTAATPDESPDVDEADVLAHGGMLLWMGDVGKDEIPPPPPMPEEFKRKFPQVRVGQSLVYHAETGGGERVWRIGWAVLRPAKTN